MSGRIILVAPLLGFALLVASPALAQGLDWYAQAEEISGCADAGPHSGWIEISAIHHLWFRTEGVGTTPEKKEFILTRPMDCSTIPFWDAFRQQTDINEFFLEAVDADPPYRLRQIIRFQQVRIQSIETAAGELPGVLVERIRFSYSRVEIESKCYTPAGDPCADHQFEYDFSQGPV